MSENIMPGHDIMLGERDEEYVSRKFEKERLLKRDEEISLSG